MCRFVQGNTNLGLQPGGVGDLYKLETCFNLLKFLNNLKLGMLDFRKSWGLVQVGDRHRLETATSWRPLPRILIN